MCDNIVNDVPVCPRCFGPLTHDVVRYHHIGRVRCESCGYHSPAPDYRATDVDIEHMQMTVEKDGRADVYPLANANNINIYNSLAAVAVLREFGLTPEQIEKIASGRWASARRATRNGGERPQNHPAPREGAEPDRLLARV